MKVQDIEDELHALESKLHLLEEAAFLIVEARELDKAQTLGLGLFSFLGPIREEVKALADALERGEEAEA